MRSLVPARRLRSVPGRNHAGDQVLIEFREVLDQFSRSLSLGSVVGKVLQISISNKRSNRWANAT